MSVSLKKLWNDYGVVGVLMAFIGLYVLYMLFNYFDSKGSIGSEMMEMNNNRAYQKQNVPQMGPQPAAEGSNEMYSSPDGAQMMPSACNMPQSQNPMDLLPNDTNSQWAQLNPAGKGDLANINLLKAGYHIGIDTIGQTLRNANQQIRSEPPNPQVNVGPWNLSTIEPDFMRVPLEIGSGPQ